MAAAQANFRLVKNLLAERKSLFQSSKLLLSEQNLFTMPFICSQKRQISKVDETGRQYH